VANLQSLTAFFSLFQLFPILLFNLRQSKFNFGGKSWKQWDIEMKKSYISAQRVEKNAIKDHKGFDRDIGWWENGDKHTDRPVMDTCLAALQLMVYYRNLPTTMASAFDVDPEILVSAPPLPKEIEVIIEGNGIF